MFNSANSFGHGKLSSTNTAPGRTAGRPPDRRRRLRRPRRRDQARRGRRARLRRHREGQRRRRHVAHQHLPGCGVRRPEPAVLLLLRPQPRLVEGLLPQQEIREYTTRRRGVRHARPLRLRHGRPRRPLGRRRAALDRPHRASGQGVRRPHRHLRLRRPLRAAAARDRRHRLLPGRDLPLGPLEPRRRPHRQAGRRDRHRRLGDPAGPRAAEDRRPPGRLPAHPELGHPAQRAQFTGVEKSLFRQVPGAQRALALRRLRAARGPRAGLHQVPGAAQGRREPGQEEHRQGDQGPRAAAPRSPRPTAPAASGS